MIPTLKSTLRKALQQLEAERERIDKQVSAIQSILNASGDSKRRSHASVQPRPKAKRRGMSAAARRAVSQRMKAYWAKRKAAKDKTARA